MRIENGVVKFFVDKPGKLFGKVDDGRELVFFHIDQRKQSKDDARRPKTGDMLVFESESSRRGSRVKWWAFQDEFDASQPVHSEYIQAELDRRSKASERSLENIRGNLDRFGVEDLVVYGVSWTYRDRREVRTGEVKLVDLLSRNASEHFDLLPREILDLGINVCQSGERIGYIDSDTRFHYSAAPDLETFLAYAVASDGGRLHELHLFSPSGSAKQLLQTLKPLEKDRSSEMVNEVFFGNFKRCLARQFIYKKTSRFGDGHMGFLRGAWNIAVRERFGDIDLPRTHDFAY